MIAIPNSTGGLAPVKGGNGVGRPWRPMARSRSTPVCRNSTASGADRPAPRDRLSIRSGRRSPCRPARAHAAVSWKAHQAGENEEKLTCVIA